MQAPPPPAVNQGIDLDDDSDKENEELDDLHESVVQNNPNVNNADLEAEETEDEFDWKYRLLEILQQYGSRGLQSRTSQV